MPDLHVLVLAEQMGGVQSMSGPRIPPDLRTSHHPRRTDCPSLVDLQGALEIGSRDGAPRWPYRWIAPAALSALLHTYHASLLLASGKTAAAAAALREAGGPEADLQPWARRLARRQAAVQALACCDLAGAARLLVDAWSTDDEAGGAEPQPSPAWTLLAGWWAGLVC